MTVSVFIVTGALTALALISYMLWIQGSVNVGNAAVKYSVGAGVITNSGTCVGSYSDDRHLDLTWDAFPGDLCEIQVAFAENGNTVDMQLQSAQTPAELITTLGADCGKLITVGDPSTPAATINFEIDSGAAFGSTITLTPDTFGLEWVSAAEYDPLLCT